MSDPVKPPSGWQPTVSTAGGALIGGAIAQLVCAGLVDALHHALSPETVGSIYTVSIAAAGYFFPDGGRK